MNNDKIYGRLWITMFIRVSLVLVLCCNGQAEGFGSKPDYTGPVYDVWVIQEFWHTGIVFPVADIDSLYWPEVKNYKDRNFIDTGWGDEKFYQATGNPVLLAARAILWPTKSVLQVFSFNTPVENAYGTESRILRIPLNREQFNSLAGFVSDSYIRTVSGDPVTSRAYGETEHYFLSTRNYHLFRTCNTWVAMAFRHAGFDVRSFCVLNANQLFRQLSKIPGAEFAS